jgi:antitoxin component of MazEF toxin-antitoxin module
MATQIIRTGSAVAVEIPEELLRQVNLAVGDAVEWTLTPAGTLGLRTPDDAEELLGSEEGYEEWKMREIEAGFADIDSGKYVDGEKVIEWVRSLGTDHRLPPPA